MPVYASNPTGADTPPYTTAEKELAQRPLGRRIQIPPSLSTQHLRRGRQRGRPPHRESIHGPRQGERPRTVTGEARCELMCSGTVRVGVDDGMGWDDRSDGVEVNVKWDSTSSGIDRQEELNVKWDWSLESMYSSAYPVGC
jgi:hypothetical protein